jgi:hypothetical protein
MLVNVPQTQPLVVEQSKLQYTTIIAGLTPIDIQPIYVEQTGPVNFGEWYCGMTLNNMFLPPSVAWMYIYKLWYLFDPDVVPDFRQATSYLGDARLGVARYTAELLVAAFEDWPPEYLIGGGYVPSFLPPNNTDTVDKLCRAVRASQALRDTVFLDTEAERVLTVGDFMRADGTYTVGEIIDA